jgi:GNAT superfamily N-acetyltransferase
VADVVDGNLHVEEVAVVPDAGGQGHGTALLDAAAAAARAGGHPAVTLTTFADVPFNRPWYERRGFSVVPADAIGPELAARMREEAELGLDPAIRVCMRRPVA